MEQLLFHDLFIEDTLVIKAENVKEANFIKTVFSHVPRRGFEVSVARKLNIKDCSFLSLSPQSIVVEKTKEVIVLGNEMTMNALDVVYAKDGSHLMISCNRILNHPVSPECSKTTTTSTTTTTTTKLPVVLMNNRENLKEDSDKETGFLPELIGGIVGGIVLILVIVFVFLILARRRRRPKTETVLEVQSVQVENDVEKGNDDPKESDSLLLGEEAENEDEVEMRPKFSAPIWLEEIQQNRIFNKQKSLLSEEGLKDLVENKAEKVEVDELNIEVKESSRTESDEEHEGAKVENEIENKVEKEEVKKEPQDNVENDISSGENVEIIQSEV